jgi:hypothetical protein
MFFLLLKIFNFNKTYINKVRNKNTDKNFNEKILLRKCNNNSILKFQLREITPIISEKELAEFEYKYKNGETRKINTKIDVKILR